MDYGIICLIPPVVTIIIAILTKSTVLSLLTGILASCIIQYKLSFVSSFINLVYSVGCAEDTVWYEFFVVLFACLLGIWSLVGATNAVAVKLRKYATNSRKTLVLTWLIGVLVFIDDFTSIAVNSTMTRLYDKNKIPRAMLTYIADSTASPICILVPFGTWAVFYQSVFSSYPEVNALGSTMSVYYKMIPSMFYGWAALIIPLLVAFGLIKPLGAMKSAYKRAHETGELYNEAGKALNPPQPGQSEETASTGQLLCFVLPLAVFIAAVIITQDVIIASIAALALLCVLVLIFRLAGVGQMAKASVNGIKDMADMILIVVLAYMMRDSIMSLGLPEYMISLCQPFISPQLLPLITFFVCSFLTFASGSNWGATLIVAAIIIPMCAAVSGNMILVLSAIVSGAAFGAHACFYCDVTVFTSAMTKIDNMEHAFTQFPYAMIGLVISSAGYLLAGLLM